jgi:hypothetical protein
MITIELTDEEVDALVSAMDRDIEAMEDDGDRAFIPFIESLNSIYAKIAKESRK